MRIFVKKAMYPYRKYSMVRLYKHIQIDCQKLQQTSQYDENMEYGMHPWRFCADAVCHSANRIHYAAGE